MFYVLAAVSILMSIILLFAFSPRAFLINIIIGVVAIIVGVRKMKKEKAPPAVQEKPAAPEVPSAPEVLSVSEMPSAPEAPSSPVEVKKKAVPRSYIYFEELLSSIPQHEISLNEHPAPRGRIPAYESVHISNVTQKTDLDKLGNFVVIDTETTGFNAQRDRVVELCAIRFRAWEPVEVFTTLVNPLKPIPAASFKVHGISDEMVEDAPVIDEVMEDFDFFIGKDNLLGHNLPFDLKFIHAAGSKYSDVKRKYYDTVTLARYINWDDPPENNKLVTLCDYYLLRDNANAHRSFSDALATGLLFKKLVDEKVPQ